MPAAEVLGAVLVWTLQYVVPSFVVPVEIVRRIYCEDLASYHRR